MLLPITTLVACILFTLLIILSFRVIGVRKRSSVSLGDGGNETLERRIRGQANLAEYGPPGVILVLLAELQSANWTALSILACLFTLGRVLHGYAFGFTDKSLPLRMAGMILTFLGIGMLILLNLYAVFIAG